MKHLTGILAVAWALCAVAEKQPFERYQSIIDRMPFGQPPAGFDPTRDPNDVSKDEYAQEQQQLTEEQEAIQKAVRFSVINIDPDGVVRVGFSDVGDPKAPRHYYLAEGETKGGWTVKAADPGEKTMTVEKDGVEVKLTLGENSGDSLAKGNDRTAKIRRRGLTRDGEDANDKPMTLRGRRERREAEEAARRRQDKEEAEKRERERAEREAALEAERERERAEREAERAEQREQLNALRDALMKQREQERANGNAEEDAGEPVEVEI